jgi:hypothetical protein
MQQIIHDIQENPQGAIQYLSDPQIREGINKLRTAGLLRFVKDDHFLSKRLKIGELPIASLRQVRMSRSVAIKRGVQTMPIQW